MSSLLKIEKNQDILILTCRSNIEHDALESIRMRLAAMTRCRHSIKILVDVREAQFKLSTMEAFEFARSNRSNFKHNAKIAVVVNQDDDNLNNYKFIENVNYNSGFPLKIFTTFDNAVRWLL